MSGEVDSKTGDTTRSDVSEFVRKRMAILTRLHSGLSTKSEKNANNLFCHDIPINEEDIPKDADGDPIHEGCPFCKACLLGLKKKGSVAEDNGGHKDCPLCNVCLKNAIKNIRVNNTKSMRFVRKADGTISVKDQTSSSGRNLGELIQSEKMGYFTLGQVMENVTRQNGDGEFSLSSDSMDANDTQNPTSPDRRRKAIYLLKRAISSLDKDTLEGIIDQLADLAKLKQKLTSQKSISQKNHGNGSTSNGVSNGGNVDIEDLRQFSIEHIHHFLDDFEDEGNHLSNRSHVSVDLRNNSPMRRLVEEATQRFSEVYELDGAQTDNEGDFDPDHDIPSVGAKFTCRNHA